MTLLDSDLEPESPVGAVIEALFAETIAFGRMATSRWAIVGDVEGYARRRALPTWDLLQVFEQLAGATVAEGLSHSYALGRWPEGMAIGARRTDRPDAQPSAYVQAMIDHWEASSPRLTTYLRLLRSALYVIHQAGLLAGIDYLFDLREDGSAPQEDSVLRVVMELVLARSRCASDAELVPFLLQGEPPAGAAGWADTITSLPDIGVAWRIDALCTESKDALMHVLDRVLREVEAVRCTGDYDAWYAGELSVCGLIDIVLRLFAQGLFDDRRPPIGISAALSGLEEIRMDGHGRARNMLLRSLPPEYRDDLGGLRDAILAQGTSQPGEPLPEDIFVESLRPRTFADDLAYARGEVGTHYQSAFEERWAHELVERRLLVPRDLGEPALTTDMSLPPRWRALSWRLAHPYVALFQPSVLPRQVRVALFEPERILAENPALDAAFARSGYDPDARLMAVTSGLNLLDVGFEPYVAQDDHPDFSASLRGKLPWMRQLASTPAQTQLLMRAVLQGHNSVCSTEVATALDRLSRASADGPEAVLEQVQPWLELYPWNDDLLFGRAVASAALGDWDGSAADAIAATALEPRDPRRWRHLSALCEHLGQPRGADLARELASARS